MKATSTNPSGTLVFKCYDGRETTADAMMIFEDI